MNSGDLASEVFNYLTGNFDPLTVVIIVGLCVLGYYKLILPKNTNKILSDTSNIKETLKHIDSRLNDVVDRVSSDSDRIDNIDKEMRDQRKICEESRKELHKKVNLIAPPNLGGA
jgi:peptidoglycan hydrolase CwlO-like protein